MADIPTSSFTSCRTGSSDPTTVFLGRMLREALFVFTAQVRSPGLSRLLTFSTLLPLLTYSTLPCGLFCPAQCCFVNYSRFQSFALQLVRRLLGRISRDNSYPFLRSASSPMSVRSAKSAQFILPRICQMLMPETQRRQRCITTLVMFRHC